MEVHTKQPERLQRPIDRQPIFGWYQPNVARLGQPVCLVSSARGQPSGPFLPKTHPFETAYEQTRPGVCAQLQVCTGCLRLAFLYLPNDWDDLLWMNLSQIGSFRSVP